MQGRELISEAVYSSSKDSAPEPQHRSEEPQVTHACTQWNLLRQGTVLGYLIRLLMYELRVSQ